MPRPPRIALWPRFWPLSRDQGARPTREVNALLSQWPSSGRWATRMAAVNGPTPGTVRYNAARWAREELLCSASWYSSSSCAISLSSQAMWRLVELATAAETPLSSRFSS